MKESIIQQCLDILKKNDITNEIKSLILIPLLNFLYIEFKPYIYVIILLVFFIFFTFIINLILLIILILILRYKNKNSIFLN